MERWSWWELDHRFGKMKMLYFQGIGSLRIRLPNEKEDKNVECEVVEVVEAAASDKHIRVVDEQVGDKDWIMNSTCSNHMYLNNERFENYKVMKRNMKMWNNIKY